MTLNIKKRDINTLNIKRLNIKKRDINSALLSFLSC
jgi:hypothetical protein